MELKEFIKQTLIDVADGVREAGIHNKKIAPELFNNSIMPSKKHAFIDFDIAVTATEGSSNAKGAGIKVLSANIGGKKENKDEKTSVTRIKFSVPAYLTQCTD